MAALQLDTIQQLLERGALSPPQLPNAMFAIQFYLQQWPDDWRILPLAYQWAESRMQQADQYIQQGEREAALLALQQLWWITPLAPGLADVQQAFELQQFWNQQAAAATVPIGKLVTTDAVLLDDAIHREFRSSIADNSPALAEFPLDEQALKKRDKNIEQSLEPVCEAIIEQGASVIVYGQSRPDYRWLMVRLTLCVRRLDGAFRLRHSYREGTPGESRISLHPARDYSLLPE